MLRVRRTLPATPGSIKQLRSLAVAFALETCEPDDQLLGDLALAVSEAATNVVKHAYHNHPEPGPIELDAYQTDSHLILRIADHGAASEQLQPGIGLHIIARSPPHRSATTPTAPPSP